MKRLAEIRLESEILLIPEKVLWRYLPIQEIEKGIRRGKESKPVVCHSDEKSRAADTKLVWVV